MVLPDSRDLTATADAKVPSGAFNNIQDAIIRHELMLKGPRFFDDFVDQYPDISATGYSGGWQLGAVTKITVSWGDVAEAAGESGILTLDQNATGAASCQFFRSGFFLRTGDDFEMEIRTKRVAAQASFDATGYILGDALGDCYFYHNSTGNWFISVNSVNTDTGVAVATTYQKLKVKRVNGQITAYIDDVQVHTVANAVSFIFTPEIRISSAAGLADNADYVKLDYFGFWAER